MNIKERKTKIWTGEYKGVGFEINNFKIAPNSIEPTEQDCWTYYLYIHLKRIPKKNNPDSFWLKGIHRGGHVAYDYYKNDIINDIELSGGCTWYSKESGFDGANRVIKIGCDYQHSWNENGTYNLDILKLDVKNSIDKFIELIPDYKYWCCGNGKLYNLRNGKIKNGSFYSKAYWGDKDWYKEL